MEQLIATYGVWAVLVGTFLEGETILVMGGYAAHRGWLELPLVLLAAFGGSFLGDQLYFTIGRRRGSRYLARRPALERRLERVRALIRRRQTIIILGSRFLYGLRIVIPFALGLSDVPAARFLVFNLIGAAVWAVTVGYLGYYLGEGMERLLGDLGRYELFGLVAIAAVGALVWVVHRLRSRGS